MDYKLQFFCFHMSLPLASKEGHESFCPLENEQQIGSCFPNIYIAIRFFPVKDLFWKESKSDFVVVFFFSFFSVDINILFQIANCSSTKNAYHWAT